VMAVL
jgi:hypothetical protein